MIIGKSLTALGGGGLKPEITVTAEAGVLLNLHYKDSSIILKSYQLGADETQHTFVVNVSETAYVVEDVTNSKSVEVLVDVVAQYNVEIDYKLWLYKDGDECEDVTGGWGTTGYSFAGSDGTKYPTYLLCQSTTNQVPQVFAVQNKIDFTPYTKLCIELDITVLENWGRVFVQACENRNPEHTFRIDKQVTTTGKQIVEIDAPDYQLYLKLMAVDNSATVKFTKVWLE